MLPIEFVQQYQRKYPKSFTVFEQMRLQRDNIGGVALPAWDTSWCFLPLLASLGHVKRHMPRSENAATQDQITLETIMVHAAVTWHITKGIYQVQSQINAASNDPGRELKMAQHLPQWCLYVEHPMRLQSSSVSGFFIFADFEPGSNITRLIFIFLADSEQGVRAIPIMIDCGATDAKTQELRQELAIPLELLSKITANDAIFSKGQPRNPQAFLATKKELKYHVASYPTIFKVQ